ncbi:SNF2-related protein [Kitasatospora sp. McL0602]|uniref:SNF2-related protein n=1 Tax=Kitasatospora sp. McL0602 TaxID=3439530 RepID=UPI003F8AEA30
MYALHALWQADGRLALWAEDAHAFNSPRARTTPGERRAAAHPYACPAEAVTRLLGALGPGLGWLAEQAPERWATLRLPTLGNAPTPSPQLPVGAVGQGVGLTAWRVPVLLFPPTEAAQLLGELFDPHWAVATAELPGSGPVEIAYGASLRWLTAVHDLAWRLVGRGRVLPVLRERDGTAYAHWQPAPDAAARRESAALADGCPPVCRAEHGVPPRTAAALVNELLDALVDREARTALDGLPSPAASSSSAAVGRWLAALHRADGRLPACDGYAELGERLAAWYAGAPDPDSPLRLCFRLVEPLGPADDDPDGVPSEEAWRLDFLLQAVDQPSLLLPAADLWAGGPALTALSCATDDPAEVYAAELARAVLRRPELAAALRSSRPTGLDLDREGALDFLRHAAPALAEAGFSVLLPAWWQRRPRLGLALATARTAAPGSVERISQVDRDAVVAFHWQAAIGELKLSAAELEALGAAQRGLVRLRGHWVEVDAAQISAALAFLQGQGSGVMPAPDVLRLALTPDAQVAGLPVTGVSAAGPLGDLLAGRTAERTPAPALPPDFGATLRPYQERGLAWLHSLTQLGLGAVLADDMGLGKTVQTLALLAAEQHAGTGGPNLLVCPMSLVGNWQREAAKFAPSLRVHVHHGTGRAGPPSDGVDLLITTYGLVQRDVAELRRVSWRRVVADEAQYIKNTATAQSRAIRALPAEHRLALTGTPVENRLAELHAILDFANPGLLGSAESFKERFAVPVEQGGNAAVAAQLQRVTAPFILRRLKTDPAIAVDLPAKQEITVWCNLTTEQAGLYQAVVADLLHRVQGIRGVERKGTVLAAIGKLKQVCNHPAQLLHDQSKLAERSGKVTRLEEILGEALAEGDRALVFTQYAEFGRLLQPHLTERLGEEVLYLHGGVPKRRREELVERFQAPGGPRVFLISLKAGGTGLNLTAANQVIHLDRWWNPAVEDQATDRAFRIGQRRDVQVRRLVCVGTVEERIAALVESKRALAEAAVGDGERWLTDLSASALRELVTLSEEADSDDR